MTKKEFGEYVENSIAECKEAYSSAREVTEKMYSDAIRENAGQSAVGVYVLEGNPDYMYHKYMERLSLSKLDRLYSLLKELTRERINLVSNEEAEAYKEDKLGEIKEEINRRMLKFESLKDEMARLVAKDAIDELIVEQKRLRTASADDIKISLIDRLGVSRRTLPIEPMEKDEAQVLANIAKDKKTLSKFFELLEEYRSLQSEVKTIGIERVIIARDLIPVNMNFSLSDIDENKLFSEETFNKIQKQISAYIQRAVDEESVEEDNFSKSASEYYYSLKPIDYKYSTETPHNEKALKHFRKMLPERIYELAMLQNQEWVRLHNKVFKTNEITTRIVGLSSEIDETKETIVENIIESYKKHYGENDVYASISTRTNGKLEYALGRESLDDFYSSGVWPTKEQISMLKRARELNKKEAEKCVLRVQVAKEKFSGLQEKALESKSGKIEKVKKQMTELVGNWENPTILSIIGFSLPHNKEVTSVPTAEPVVEIEAQAVENTSEKFFTGTSAVDKEEISKSDEFVSNN